MMVAILASVASLIIRYRRAVGEEKQQLKWVALGVIVLAIGFAATVAWPGTSDDTENFVVALALTAVPISIGIAILRYRLYDIDRIISRTVSYGIVTALLAGAFVGLVVVLGGVLPTRGSSLAVAGSTLAVAALFNPLRYRVQGVVDRKFNRSQYDLERTIEAFSQRLRTEADLDRIGRDLQDVAAESMHPKSISLWLRA
jgi:signal transduction histidine kinase